MSVKLTDVIAQASAHDLHDLACFLTSKFKIQTFNAATDECADVQEEGIVTALNDWAALGGGIAVGKE
ncbi:hypothetical protein [uncultured Roseobacter sp.]|uniref:hypothetical protein n=1 Tax=uncultured Roseobacter sp. TaxID=114847 RepID=UPI0026239A21|nr:hypothetical protein [uncultured Roseobacter sp.]